MSKDDPFYSNFPGSTKKKSPYIYSKEAREEVIDMAAEQFASLLWQQHLFEVRSRKTNKLRTPKLL